MAQKGNSPPSRGLPRGYPPKAGVGPGGFSGAIHPMSHNPKFDPFSGHPRTGEDNQRTMAHELQKVRYVHEAMIDTILAQPSILQKELAAKFNYSAIAIGYIVRSDAFKERLAQRKEELVDPLITCAVEEQFTLDAKLEGLAHASLDRLIERIENKLPMTNSDLISAAKLGVGEKKAINPYLTQNNYIVQLPPVAADPKKWLEGSSRGVSEAVVDVSPRGLTDA